MSAIYQRARPIRWQDIVGQEHVKDVLKTALEQGRIGHAYLFSGPRGVGKTTTARLIAMTANCTGPDPKPCGECESCLAVRSGNHPDVMEIDAASNNSVDDVRDLREKVGLAAMRGGKKIYILDEAHMMSRAAFNALLKTLEEPPGHVVFILATTEPEKIIPTILSRCQHYRFRRLTPEEIAGKLAGLAQGEGATADPDALNLMGRLADGAMRDGESLLERMLAAGTAITRPAVEEALGLPPGERVRGVAAALLLGDAGVALSGAAQLYRDGFAARTVVEGLVSAFGAALHAELGLGQEGRLEGAEVPRLLRLQAALDEQESRFARSADQQSLELALTHALLAADGGSGTGGVAVGAGASAAAVPADLLQRLSRLEKELATLRSAPRAGAPGHGSGPGPVAAPPPERRGAAPAVGREVAPAAAPNTPTGGSWGDVLAQTTMQMRAFLKPARMHAQEGYVSLTYEDRSAFHAKQVAGKFDELALLVGRVFGSVTFELIAPEGLGKRREVGGRSAPAPASSSSATPPVQAAPLPAPAAEIPDFEPTPRRPRQADAQAAAPAPAPPKAAAQTPPGRAAALTLPPRRPGQEAAAPRPASDRTQPDEDDPFGPLDALPLDDLPLDNLSPARQDAPVHPAPNSPDDVAPAPLPVPEVAPWDEENAADAPPAPADAQGGDRVTPPGQRRELYLGEVITEEPDWDSFGTPLQDDGPPLLDDAPFAEYSAPRPAVAPRPAPPQAAAPAAPARPGDIRAHPVFEEVKGRFPGRVREIGKNRRSQVARTEAAEEGGDDTPEDAIEA